MSSTQTSPSISHSVASFFRSSIRKIRRAFESKKYSTLSNTATTSLNSSAPERTRLSLSTESPSFVMTRYDSPRPRRKTFAGQESRNECIEQPPRSKLLISTKGVSIQNDNVVLPRRCLMPTELWDSIDLHMTLIEGRLRRELRIKRWTLDENELYDHLDTLRTEIARLVAFAWLKYGLKLFVHDFLFVEEGHSLGIVMPLSSRTFRRWTYARWQLKVNTFREAVTQCSINHMLTEGH